jgi:hypothetical protein
LKLRLSEPGTQRRGKPANVRGATTFSYVGEQPPPDVEGWKFETSVTRTELYLDFPTTLPSGTKVWLTAFRFNSKSESGPACPPVVSRVGFGGLSLAA